MKSLLFGAGPSKIPAPASRSDSQDLLAYRQQKESRQTPALHIAPVRIGPGVTMPDALPDHPGRSIPGVYEKEDAKENIAAGAIDV